MAIQRLVINGFLIFDGVGCKFGGGKGYSLLNTPRGRGVGLQFRSKK